MDFVFRVFDFNVYNEKPESDSSDEETKYKETASFMIQIFGVNEKGEDCSIIAENYKPFFYVLVDDDWTISKKNDFVTHLTNEMGKFYHESICDSKLLKRKKLYGFNDGKEYKFIKLEFCFPPRTAPPFCVHFKHGLRLSNPSKTMILPKIQY